jgi:hypothetical protein
MSWDNFLQGTYLFLQDEKLQLGVDYRFYDALYFDHDGFNTIFHRGGGILASRQGPLYLAFQPNFQATSVDSGRDLQKMMGEFPFTLRYFFNETFDTEFYYHFQINDYDNVLTPDFSIPNSFLRDSLAHGFGLVPTLYFLQKRGFVNLGFEFNYEDARNPYDLLGPKFFGTVGFPLPLEFSGEIFASYFLKYYFHDDLPDLAFVPNGITREDQMISAGARLRRVVWGPIWASVGYEFLYNNSNEAFFEYEKHLPTIYFGVTL